MTKFIVVFLGVWVKLVALNTEGGYETGIGTLQWHPAIAPRPLPQNWSLPSPPSTIAHYNGTLQWSVQWHPAMPLRPLPQSWYPPPTIAQWHPAMAPSNGTTSTPPKHTTMAPCNGTQQGHYVHSPNHSTLEWHPAMAPSNGTTSTPPKLVVTLSSPHHSTRQWHPAMAPRPLHSAMAPGCHVQSAKVVRRPPPYWK